MEKAETLHMHCGLITWTDDIMHLVINEYVLDRIFKVAQLFFSLTLHIFLFLLQWKMFH